MIEQLDYWHWWIFGCILLVLEMLLPGVFFMWLAIASAIIGGLLLMYPELSLSMQFFLFGVISVSSVLAWRFYSIKNPPKTDEPFLNRRGEMYVGRTLNVTEAINNGFGRVRLDDSIWKVSGPDCPVGSQVKVIGVDGLCLQVELVRRAEPLPQAASPSARPDEEE
jgi:membrane protein implicated in regulation of membrane protease activity